MFKLYVLTIWAKTKDDSLMCDPPIFRNKNPGSGFLEKFSIELTLLKADLKPSDENVSKLKFLLQLLK